MFFKAVEDRFATAVQFDQLVEPVTDRRDLDFVQAAGDLFPVAGNKRNRGVLAQQVLNRCDLFNIDIEFLADDVLWSVGVNGSLL